MLSLRNVPFKVFSNLALLLGNPNDPFLRSAIESKRLTMPWEALYEIPAVSDCSLKHECNLKISIS